MAKKKKVKAAVKAVKADVKRNVKKAKKAKAKFDVFAEKLALFLGVGGFVLLAGLLIVWIWRSIDPASVPQALVPANFIGIGIIAMFAASFVGWLIVNDGQALLERRSGRKLALAFFLVLPIVCLIGGVFPSWTARTFNLPAMDAQPMHVFWLIVRWYPIALVATCLIVAFKREAQTSKGKIRRKPALKFALLAAPYVALMIFQELSLKEELLEEGLRNTLGAAGINFQLILAVMTGSRYA